MGKCTKSRCPMQVGTVDENCDIKDCPYRTDSDWLIKAFVEGVQKYFESTTEITKKVRVPKGDTCDGCLFKKQERYDSVPYVESGCDCIGGRGIWCALYGERLELSDIFRNNGLMCVTISPENWTYNKCKGCLEDTNGKE